MADIKIVNSGIIKYGVKVREEGQLETFSITVNEFENVSALSRLSFTWTIVPFDPANDGTLLLVQNDSDQLVLHIEEVEVQSDLATVLKIHLTDRATLTPSGTAVVGVCWNQTAPRVAPAIAKANETNNVLGNIIYNFPIVADTQVAIPMFGAILLAKGQSIGVDLGTSPTSLASCHIKGYFAIPDEERL